MKIESFPILETKRLVLRQLKINDKETIQFLRSDDAVNQFIKRQRTKTLEEAINFITKINNQIKESELIFWGITQKDNPELIGTISLWHFSEDQKTAEVGYDLHPQYHKQGIMNEALYCILDYGFNTLHLDSIEAFTHKDNVPSKKLLKAHNFKHIADRKDDGNLDNRIFIVSKVRFRNKI